MKRQFDEADPDSSAMRLTDISGANLNRIETLMRATSRGGGAWRVSRGWHDGRGAAGGKWGKVARTGNGEAKHLGGHSQNRLVARREGARLIKFVRRCTMARLSKSRGT